MQLTHQAKMLRYYSYLLLGLFSFGLFMVNSAVPIVAAATPQTSTKFSLGQTVSTEDFTFNYPEEFIVESSYLSLKIGSSQKAIDQIYESHPRLTSGDAVFDISYILGSDISALGLSKNGTDVILKGYSQKNNISIDAIQHFKLGAVEGSRANWAEQSSESSILIFQLNHTLFFIKVTTAPNEITQYEELLSGMIQAIHPTPSSPPLPIVSNSYVPKLDKSFVSEDKRISFDYPAGWVIDDQGIYAGQINLASSAEALTALKQNSLTKLTSRQIVIQIYYGSPIALITSDTESTSLNLMQKFAESNSWPISSIEPFTLGPYRTSRIEISGTNYSAASMGIMDGSVPILTAIFTAPQGLENAEAILNTIVRKTLERSDQALIHSFVEAGISTPSIVSSSIVKLGQTFISSDNSFRFNYPSGWVVHTVNVAQVFIANSDKAINEVTDSSSTGMSSGNFGAELSYAPVNKLPQNVDKSGDAVKLLNSLATSIPAVTKMGKIESYTIGERHTARVRMTAKSIEFVIYLFYVDQNVVIIIGTATTGELDKFQPALEAIIQSIELNMPNSK